MRTTIDSAGRLVVPKRLRDALGLRAGSSLLIDVVDGRIEIEVAPIEADVEIEEGLPRIVPRETVQSLDDSAVRDALERIRR